MEPRHRTATFLSLVLFLLISCVSVSNGADPSVTVNSFRNFPGNLFFFDDSTSVVWHDVNEGVVYISQDEGKSWAPASDIPAGEAAMVIAHPFENRYAFVLTKGTTHYRTDDRGRTWRSFTTPLPPAYMTNPLSFHSKNFGKIIYHGLKCEKAPFGWGSICHDEAYYVTEAFSDEPQHLLSETSRCQFAHSSKDFKHEAPEDLIYCVAFDTSSATGSRPISSSRLYATSSFFKNDNSIIDLDLGRPARGVVAFAIVSKFAVVALRDTSASSAGETHLYVTVDAQTWARAEFPQSSSAKLLENAYTIVESTTHSLAVDVLLHPLASVGTLFVSNSNGTFFVESLRDTNRNEMGFVDFENIYGVEGVGLANVVANAQEVIGRNAPKQLMTRITFDDGSTWSRVIPPGTDSVGNRIDCDPSDADCSLHLHSVTTPHNFGRIFSSPAPGFVMGVGSVGRYLKPYEECDTFLSTDGGVSWVMVTKDAHKYEFGDQGSILIAVNDEDGVNNLRYSSDLGKSWQTLDLGMRMRARALTTVPDSTSQKFLLVAQLAREDQVGDGRFAAIFLDFAATRPRQCTDSDFEQWYARTNNHECIMGHKQWYRRRKPDANCYVGNKFDDPVAHEENCPCTDDDFECDYNYIRSGKDCIPAGPEPVPSGVCSTGEGTYMGSSGYRLIPGNTCDRSRGVDKDKQVEKSCSQAQPEEGQITHQIFPFRAQVVQDAYFKDSKTILVRLSDSSVWQSSNEGYTWQQVVPGTHFVAFYMHSHTHDRAYLITETEEYWYTTDTGATWNSLKGPAPPNTFGAQVLHFQPRSDNLIWTGNKDCGNLGGNCRAAAYYTTDNGRHWYDVESYVRNCAWARDKDLKIDSTQIICESYRDKTGDQRFFQNDNPLQLVGGSDFFKKKKKIFDHVVGFAKFSEFLIVAEFLDNSRSLDLQVSLDGKNFATGVFPPQLRPENHAYTILESSTMSVFMHLTTSEFPNPFWGSILKSNGNGTYFGETLSYVNRNDRGFVDFEKMIGLDGIAIVNVVANPSTASMHGRKELQTRITHNDGGSWKPLTPPTHDSDGRQYDCTSTRCALQIHGYTERYDSRATYSSPSAPGIMMAVGNVGETLAPYTESNIYLSRDAGFTWEEVHKDAHVWEFGDSGSILVIANDEEPTDHVLFSTDEGASWREYHFTHDNKIRIRSIMTVTSDTSRKFILFGNYPRDSKTVAVHLDFSSLTHKKCVLDTEDPGHDDFEMWSPAEERQERCLFGRQVKYHRRRRDRNCVVGDQPKAEEKFITNCQCTEADFECEFNHRRDEQTGECVLVTGATPLPDDDSCKNGEDNWYGRTAYRKIPYSTCEGGLAIDRGIAHTCPGIKGHGFFFWIVVIFFPTALAALIGYWFYKKAGLARGTIRLPGEGVRPSFGDSTLMDTLASVPWFLIGLLGIAWERFRSVIPVGGDRVQRGYRSLAVDEDAQVLRFEDEPDPEE